MDDTQKIIIKGDEILAKHAHWHAGEQSDSSSAGTRREAIGRYCEEHGIENKAFSQARAGLKIKNDGKRRDWLRTWQLLLPVLEQEIFKNEPEMDLGEPEEEDVEAPEEGEPVDFGGEDEPEGEADIQDDWDAEDDNVTPLELGAAE